MGKRELGQTPSKVCSTGGALIKRRLAFHEQTCRMAQFSFGCDRKQSYFLPQPGRRKDSLGVSYNSTLFRFVSQVPGLCFNYADVKTGALGDQNCETPGPAEKHLYGHRIQVSSNSSPSPTTLPRTEGAKGSRPATPQLTPPHAKPARGERARRPRPPPLRPETHCSAGHRTAIRSCPPAAAFPPSRAAALAGPGDAAPASRAGFSARLVPGHAPGWGMVPRLMRPPKAAATQRFSRLRAIRGPSRRGARQWPPPLPLYSPPASATAQDASARVTAARPAASDPR